MIPETPLFTDDAKVLGELLRREWSLPPGKEPSIAYDVRSSVTSSRYASVFIYMVNRSTRIASVDYNQLERVSHLAIKVNATYRENFLEVVQEIERIIMSCRRAGKTNLGGYTYVEMTSERFSNDLSGYYSCTIEVCMTSHNTPLHTAGMASPVNEAVHERQPY